jgi:uracil phosphoribosyltransferase
MKLHVVGHPLVDDVLAALRDRRTEPAEFRRLAHRASLLVTAEATRDLPTAVQDVETPLETTRCRVIGRRVVAVPVLRAGLGMLDAFLELVPSAEVGYFGLERNEQTAVARRYYEKVPRDLGEAVVYLLDPMLATGGSAAMAIEGLAHLEQHAPEAEVFTAALDRQLNDRKYILPGLGDFGDRLFGT